MKQRAPRNKTITIQLDEKQELKNRLATVGTLRTAVAGRIVLYMETSWMF